MGLTINSRLCSNMFKYGRREPGTVIGASSIGIKKGG
jgi:hypothetical protein